MATAIFGSSVSSPETSGPAYPSRLADERSRCDCYLVFYDFDPSNMERRLI